MERPAATADYSGNPLARKLGIMPGCTVLCIDAPVEYRGLLEPIPTGLSFRSRAVAGIDLAHVFVTRREDLCRHLLSLRGKLRPETPVWVSWPKLVVQKELH